MKTISEIETGVMVLGKHGFRKVLKVTKSSSSPTLSINGIETTPNHQFIMEDEQLRRADQLELGDILFDGIEVCTIEDIFKEGATYNLIVEGNTYYVGDMLVSSSTTANLAR